MRNALELVEARLQAGEPGEALLALIAGTEVDIPEDELRGACRRALLVLAAGGDPHREPALDSRAVQVLAQDLDAPERRAALTRGLAALREHAADLQLVSAEVDRLASDSELAWLAFALALLADELAE